jgi:hypothetical protein
MEGTMMMMMMLMLRVSNVLSSETYDLQRIGSL